MTSHAPLTTEEIVRALKRAYPQRVHSVLHISRSPLRGGISNARREGMNVYFHNRRLGVEEMHLVAKQAPRSAYLIMSALSSRRALRGHIPTPLLYKKCTLLYRALWGDQLRHYPFTEKPSGFLRYAAEAGKLLAHIHATPAPTTLVSQVQTTARRRKHLRTLQEKFPSSMERYPIKAPDAPKRPIRLVHGDFQASNLIVTMPDGLLGVVDFAAGGRGDAATDVASFLIHGRMMLRGVIPQKITDKAMQRFLSAYRQLNPAAGPAFEDALFAARFDVLLSVLGTTIAHLEAKDANLEHILEQLDTLLEPYQV